MSTTKPKLAIDVGGVLIEKADRTQDTSFDLNNVKWIPGALETLPQLSPMYELYILSFCGRATEAKTRAALKQAKVDTIIPEEKWIFTRDRLHKLREMVKHDIGILIDDTKQIVDHIRDYGLRCIYFRCYSRPFGDDVKNWKEALEVLSRSANKKQIVPNLESLSDFPCLS